MSSSKGPDLNLGVGQLAAAVDQLDPAVHDALVKRAEAEAAESAGPQKEVEEMKQAAEKKKEQRVTTSKELKSKDTTTTTTTGAQAAGNDDDDDEELDLLKLVELRLRAPTTVIPPEQPDSEIPTTTSKEENAGKENDVDLVRKIVEGRAREANETLQEESYPMDAERMERKILINSNDDAAAAAAAVPPPPTNLRTGQNVVREVLPGAQSVAGPGGTLPPPPLPRQEQPFAQQLSQGLSQAFAIDEDLENASPVDLEELQKTERSRKEERNFRIAALAWLLLAAALILGLVLGLNRKDDLKDKKGAQTVADTDAPTPSPTRPLVPMENLELLYDFLPEKTKDYLYDSDSPQYQAWEWLINHPNITTYPEWRKNQIFAMATFFYSFEGPNWPESFSGQDRWMNVTTSECSWVLSDNEVAFWAQKSAEVLGPTAYDAQDYQPCNKEGRLQILLISQLFLPAMVKPSIPQEIELLTSLKSLVMVFSQLNSNLSDDLLVPELLRLPRLEFVNFHEAGVSGTIPADIALMTGLRHLMIGVNELTGDIPSELFEMTSLEKMGIDDMKGVTGKLPSELGLMTRLTALEVDKNSLNGQIPSELGLLTDMWRLSLEKNTFTGSLPEELWGLSQLDRLLLANLANVHGRISSEISMPLLTELSLSGSPHLAGTIPDDFCFIKEFSYDCSDLLCGCDCLCVNGTNV